MNQYTYNYCPELDRAWWIVSIDKRDDLKKGVDVVCIISVIMLLFGPRLLSIESIVLRSISTNYHPSRNTIWSLYNPPQGEEIAILSHIASTKSRDHVRSTFDSPLTKSQIIRQLGRVVKAKD